MSFNTAALTAWVDENKFPLLMQLQAKSGLAEVVAMQSGIKSSARLHSITTTAPWQSNGCSYNASGTTTFGQKTITVGDVAIMEDVCSLDLEGFWTQQLMKEGKSAQEVIPGEIESKWMAKKLNTIAHDVTVADFQGDTLSGNAQLNKYDGLLKLLAADATVIQGNTTGLLVAPTTANILAVMDGIYTVIPEDLSLDNPDAGNQLYLWLPLSYYKMYIIALKNANLFHRESKDGDTNLYGTNIILKPTVGLAGTDKMVLTYADNITIGVDGTGDADQMDVWYSKDDRITKSLVTFKRGVQYQFGNYIVLFQLGVS
jgi:hypothetical protein